MTAAVVTRQNLIRTIRSDVRKELGWLEAHDWVYYDHADPYAPDEIDELTKLQEQWAALCEQGEAEGRLYRTGGYPGHELKASTLDKHPTRTTRIRETKADRTYRIKKITAGRTPRTSQRPTGCFRSLPQNWPKPEDSSPNTRLRQPDNEAPDLTVRGFVSFSDAALSRQ